MSCNSCGYSPCCCAGGLTVNVSPTICCTPTTESVEYTAENVNLNGIGVLNGTDGTNFEFRGIVSDTLALTVELDAPNKSIVLSFNDELLIDDIPTFTETIRGIGEAATQAETNAGVVDNVIITPLKLGARAATETLTGLAEIATQAEVNAGVDDTRFVTPLKLTTFAANSNTRTFADAVARAAATPTFDGQVGIQLDTNAFITATGTTPGSFTPNFVVDGTLFLGSNGAAATPVFTWTADQNTGFYRIGIDTFAAVTGGNEICRFASDGADFGTNPANRVLIADGTASDPSLCFTNDSQTGFYEPIAEQIGITIAGTQVAAIDTNSLDLKAGLILAVDNTISGGTGDVVINKMAGTANIAAAATGLTVTNSFVSANSVILCQVASNDSTLKTVAITQTAGSFTLVGNAAANATTRVNWLVINKS